MRKLRIDILFKLGFQYNGTSLLHKSGAEVSHFELDTLSETEFLKVMNHVLSEKKIKCKECANFKIEGRYLVCKDCGDINNDLKASTMEENDVFITSLLKMLHSVFKKFGLIKRIGNIYIIGYDKATYEGVVSKGGGNIDIQYPETDIYIVDRSCVEPFTREWFEIRGSNFPKEGNDKEWLKGHAVACKILPYHLNSKKKTEDDV